MNRILCLFLVTLLGIHLCACDKKPSPKPEESLAPEEIYEFLNTEYVVTSKQVSFYIIYECNYYFIDGVVAGEKQMTTFPNEDDAQEFHEIMKKEYPDAILEGTTVTIYTDDDDETFYGSTLEKLLFSLELADYEITYNFDKDEFLALYEEEEE